MTDLLSMDDILKPATPGSAPWPNAPAMEGQVYGFKCPLSGTDMVAMTKETFLNFGTQMEAMRRAGVDLDKKTRELVAQYADLQTKHMNLRDATRKDRLARLEDKIVLPNNGGTVRKPPTKR